MKKRVADIVMDILVDNGVSDAFCVVGGGAMHLDNALARSDKISKYYNHHEQACALSAEAYVRVSGCLPLVCVTSGPGGTNTLTGVLCAWQDSLPMLIIAGQVRNAISIEQSGLNLRQRGEQEFEIVPVVKHMTKYAVKIKDPLSIKRELIKAITLATTGRRGPVWIDMPLDVQGTMIEEDDMYPDYVDYEIYRPKASGFDFELLNSELKKAKRPCILFGSGIRTSNTVDKFRSFVERVRVPVVSGIHITDGLYFEYPLYYGMSGTLGPRVGNFIIQNADLIVTIGNSLHLTQTGFNVEAFAPNAKIIMIDIDLNEALKPGLRIYKFIHTDLDEFFDMAESQMSEIKADEDWIKYCDTLMKKFPIIEIPKDLNLKGKIRQNYFWKIFEEKEPSDCIVCFGNSMGVAGVAQKGIRKKDQRLIANYWVGTMGHDLPEAFGAAIASKHEVILATGDGSIMLNLQELETIRHYDLPIKIILFSNDGYGTIRNTCKNFFDGTMVGCDPKSGLGMPNFEKVVKAFDFGYKKCESNDQIAECLEWLFNESEKQAVLEVMQDYNDAYVPKLKSRLREDNTFETPALHDMAPFITKEELNQLMFW